MNPQERQSRLVGALLVAAGAVAFSGKGVIIKLAYRHGVDAVTLLALRMLLSAPFFAALGLWAARRGDVEPLSWADRRTLVVLGLIGYYLASYFDFLGLQYVTAALERLLLFVHPTFVV
ncbi:MAG TPA: EamA family transporter, partial [Usitatibacter sp.]